MDAQESRFMKQDGCMAYVSGGKNLCEQALSFLLTGQNMNEENAEELCETCIGTGNGVYLIWIVGNRIVQAYFSEEDMYYYESDSLNNLLEEDLVPEEAVQILMGEKHVSSAVCMWTGAY